jgi:hypothetical protein
MSTKDILDVVVIPVTLAILALLWPAIQARARRTAFRRLIVRELEEIGPYPLEPNGSNWWEHQRKEFVHAKIFADTSKNRDFILSLEPDLVYLVSQLWNAKRAKDQNQWLHYLQMLSDAKYDREGWIAKAHQQWVQLCSAYKTRS